MASQWYCRVEDQEYGPYSSSQLKQMVRDRQLLPEHQVRQGAEGRWILASQVQGLFAAAPAKPIKQAEPLAPQARAVVTPAVATPVNVTPVTPVSAIPMGVPVGAVPVGIPVDPAYGVGVPVGVVSAGFPVITTAGPAASSYQSNDLPVGTKKNQTALYATIGMAACLLLLVGIGGAVGLGFFKSKPAEKNELVAADSGKNEQEPDENVEPETVAVNRSVEPTTTADKSDDAKTAAAKQGGSPAKPDAAAKVEKSGKPNADQEKAIRSVKQWREYLPAKLIKFGNVQVQVSGVWFDSSALGSAREESPDGVEQSAPQRKRVQIEVVVTNVNGPGALLYKSWNGAGKRPQDVAAVLLDGDGTICPLVSRENAPSESRQQTAEIIAGQSLKDLLVFDIPDSGFDHLKLVLPITAVGRDASQAIGFQIPRDMVAPSKSSIVSATSPSAPSAAVSPKPPAATEDTGGQPATIGELGGAINKPPVKKPVDPDAPPSPKELDKQLQDAKKLEAQQKAAEQKAAEDKAAGNKSP